VRESCPVIGIPFFAKTFSQAQVLSLAKSPLELEEIMASLLLISQPFCFGFPSLLL
jgi:hypothetical protein